jgi:predicted nucleic acid-binding protein
MIVVDASAVLEVLLRTERAEKVEARLFRKTESLCAPDLLDLEVIQVLRRYSGKEMPEDRAQLAIFDFEDLPITRYPHDIFVRRIWQLRKSLTAYDAAYVALAEALEAPLLTCDARLASSRGHSAQIQLIV